MERSPGSGIDVETAVPGTVVALPAALEAPTASSRATIARNASHLVFGQAATTGLAVVLTATLGRSLGAADFGLYFLFTSMATFAFVVVEWGQGQYLIREIAIDPARAGDLLGTAIALRLTGTAAGAAVTVAVATLYGNEHHAGALAALTVASLLPYFVSQAYGAMFRALERMDIDALVGVTNKVLAVVFTIAVLLVRRGLPGVLLAQGGAGLGALALAVALSRRLGVRAGAVSMATARELLRGGAPLVAMTLAVSAQQYVDAVLLAKLAPKQAVGWYGAARSVFGTLLAPATILAAASFPRLSRAAGAPGRLRGELETTVRPVLLLASVGAVGTYLLADFAVSVVYGRVRFAPAGLILKAFAPGLFLLFVDILLGTALIASGRSVALAAVKVANVVLSTVLDLLLVPWCQARFGNGGIGLVVAFGASELLMFVGAILLLPRGGMGTTLFVDLARAIAVALGTVAVAEAVRSTSSGLVAVASLVAFGALALGLRLVGRAELQFLAAAVRSPLRRERPPRAQ